jgi:hypothetical protein
MRMNYRQQLRIRMRINYRVQLRRSIGIVTTMVVAVEERDGEERDAAIEEGDVVVNCIISV